jgi:hypothetical protein
LGCGAEVIAPGRLVCSGWCQSDAKQVLAAIPLT